MLFNSVNFAIFLPVVFVLYWFVANKNLKLQNVLLLAASYFFYACWDWRFLFLLLFSTLLDFFTGIQMEKSSKPAGRKIWFWLSIAANLGFLGIFKYYNFFAESFAEGLALLGVQANIKTLQVILPVGISFYTFHGLSYVIDIYKRKISAEKDFIQYAVFVSFFPLLVAGPIERATHLLPQIKKGRFFDYTKAVDGLRQILWGLFKKVVVADNCAEYVNYVFAHPEEQSGSTLALGAVFFAFQIYGDFSGYSDIALGTARLFGIELLKNFAFPYFSRDIAEFWRRWHISLSSWFRDYLYIPLGGSKTGTFRKIRNTFVIFIVSGFWHGANWTFIVWGLLNALYIMPSIISGTNRNHIDTVGDGRVFPRPKEFLQMFITFCLTVLAWIFFRAESISHAFEYISGMFSISFFSLPESFENLKTLPSISLLFITLCMAFEWLARTKNHALESLVGIRKPFRYVLYYSLIFTILWYGGREEQFIYFQF